MTVLRTLQLWLTTALRAAPILTSFMCLTTILSSVLSPLSIYGVSLAVSAAGRNASLWPGILLAGGCLLVSAMAANVSYPIGDTVDDKVDRHVHDDLLQLTADVPTIAHHEDPALADRLALVQRDAHELGGIYRLLTTVGAVTGTATVVALLWSVGPGLSVLLVFAAIPSVVHGVGQYRRNALWKGSERFRRVAHKTIDVLSDPRQGVEVRCFGLSATLTGVASDALGMRNRPWMSVTSRYAKLTAIGWLGFGVCYAVAVLWLLQQVRDGAADVGDLALLLLIGPQVVTTGQGISANVRMILGALQTFGRYQWLREYSATHSWSESTLSPPDRLTSGIRFDHVDFAYPSAEAAGTGVEPAAMSLRDVSLDLPAGTTVAFVGENGAGKSTLVKLLARLYDPTSGDVLIDGVPLRQIDAVQWRERMSAGFQDFASLELLTADSVGVGDLDSRDDRERVDSAVDAGQARPVVDGLRDGLDTQLGTQFTGGVGLSGGQWQRLALARAFMRSKPLLMLLDEPTAALDPEAEQAVYEQYGVIARQLARTTGAVTVLVSHRFSTVRMADLIVVVADGRIAELGSHAELLAGGGRYAELFDLQARAYR
jgi:ATP-binding cassette subfamily B protein